MRQQVILTGFADEIAGDLTTQMAVIRKLSMNHIEMRGVDGGNLIFHTPEKVTEIKSRLDENGIRLSALGSPLGKIGITDAFEPHFEAFKKAVDIAHRMDTKNIRMFSFYLPGGADPEAYREAVFDRIGQFVDYADRNDAVLLHENEKGIYGERAAECKKLLDAFGGKSFKAVFDFANFVQAKQDTMEAYELLKDHIAYVHVKDAVWESGAVVPAGMGDGQVAEILKKMLSGGYRGFLSLEPHLGDFDGFHLLERSDQKTPMDGKRKLTGEEAFTLAHDSLIKLLETIA